MTERVYTQVFAVASGLIERDGKFLLIQENLPGHPDDKKWNLPGGWVEVNEDPLESVRREAREETGHDFTPTALLGVYSLVKQWSAHTHQAIKLVYRGTIGGTEHQLLGDTLGFRWFSAEEIFALDTTTLRDMDIGKIVRDAQSGQSLPLDVVNHFVQH